MTFHASVRLPTPDRVLIGGSSDVERTFMTAVYWWMTLGLAVTALIAYSVASSQEALQLVTRNRTRG